MTLYRNLTTGRIEPLPWRVRLADGSTRTDPEQWASDPDALAAAGFEETTRTQEDDDYDYAAAFKAAYAAKLAEIDAAWQTKLSVGWMPPGEDFSLGIDIPDVTLLLGAYTLSKDAAALGLPDEVAIIDTAGGLHTYNSQLLTPLLLQYGSARATMSATDAMLRQQLAAATTLEEIAAITVA